MILLIRLRRRHPIGLRHFVRHKVNRPARQGRPATRDFQKAGALFGNEKDESFKSSLETIYQTFDGIDLYPSLEEKAANLLYFVVKNHSFSVGNKRIAAGLFIYFLDLNNKLYTKEGNKRIGDNALVAITIMIAESKSDEKEMMIKLVVNLINNNN